MKNALGAILLAAAAMGLAGCHCCCDEGVPVSLENLSNWWHFHGPACRHYPNSCPCCPYYDYEQCCWHPLCCGLQANCPEAPAARAPEPAVEAPPAPPPPAPKPAPKSAGAALEPVPAAPPTPKPPAAQSPKGAKPAAAPSPAKREVRRLPAIGARSLEYPQSSLEAFPQFDQGPGVRPASHLSADGAVAGPW